MYGCFGKKLKKKEEEEEEEENIGSKPGDNNNSKSKNKSKRVSSLASNCGGEQSFSRAAAAVVASAALDNNSSTHSATFDDLSNHGGTGSSSFSESTSSQPSQLEQQQEKGLFESSTSSSFLVVGGEEEEGVVIKEEDDKDKEEKAFRIAALTAASALSPVSARTTALRCYYCPAGFLVSSSSPGEEVEEKEDPKEEAKQPEPFSCVDCGQRFPRGLPFILRLVGEQTADAAYWQAEHDRRKEDSKDGPRDVAHQAAALAMWRQALQQLRKLLPDASLRLLTAQLTLAEAAYCCSSEPSAEARQLLNGVLEQLLGGVLEPLEAVGEKRALLQAMTTALKMLRQMEGEDEDDQQQQQQQLKGKIEQLEMLLLLEPQKEAAAAVE